jgi:predicted ATPase
MPGLSERAPLSRTGGALRLTFDRYHLADGKLYRDGVLVDVEPRAVALIALLASNAGRLLPNDELIATLWPEAPPTANALHYTVSVARKALEDCTPKPIVNVRGKGYHFDAEVDFSSETDSGDVFVGRSEELAKLNAALQRAERDRRPAFLLVSGPPGAGKTELARRFCAQLAETRVRHVWGQCFAGAEAPAFWPWEEFWSALVPEELPTPDSGRSQISGGEADVGWKRRPTPHLNAPQLRQERSGLAVARLANATSRGPLVLVFDDLHLAGDEAVELLCFLSTTSAAGPVVFLATHRSESADSATAGVGRLRRFATGLALPSLGPRVSYQLLRALSARPLPPQTEKQLLERAGGNPLFLRELARLANQGTDHSKTPFHVPSGITTALERHVSVLPDATRRALELASLLGQRFDAVVLSEMLGRSAEQVLTALSGATRLELLRPHGATQFEFAHALYQQHLYESFDAEARRLGHLAAGAALNQLRPEGGGPGAVARHLVLGAKTEDETRRAAEVSRQAGASYLRRHAYAPAAECLSHALELGGKTGITPHDEIYLRLELGECLWLSSKRDAAQVVLTGAIDLARAQSDAIGLGLAVLAYGRLLVEQSLDPQLFAYLEEALLALPAGEEAVRAQLLARKVECLYMMPRAPEFVPRSLTVLSVRSIGGDARCRRAVQERAR